MPRGVKRGVKPFAVESISCAESWALNGHAYRVMVSPKTLRDAYSNLAD
jgi:hypothetical protein